MGYQGKSYALVSMTNKDTYYVTIQVGKEIQNKLAKGGENPFIRAFDINNKNEVVLNVNHISSVVVKEVNHA